ncbi:MAG: bacterioferritin [Neisseriaceae bacterium]|nr:bacterioferritin [Neisseriaceae bacterium]
MNGDKKVIDYLNKLLAGELMARDQYFIHSRMYREWGYNKLFEHLDHEMAEETQHADALISRILMLGGKPDMQPEPLNVGTSVETMLQSDLNIELSVRDALKQGMVLCEKACDFVSRDLLLAQLKDTEEDHAHWLEQQLRLIDTMGLPNYLQLMQ